MENKSMSCTYLGLDIPKQIIGLRAELGISQTELARKLCVSPSTVNRWESGQSMPRAQHTKLLTSNMGVENLRELSAGNAVLGGLTLSKFIRNAGKLGLSVEQIADLLEQD